MRIYDDRSGLSLKGAYFEGRLISIINTIVSNLHTSCVFHYLSLTFVCYALRGATN